MILLWTLDEEANLAAIAIFMRREEQRAFEAKKTREYYVAPRELCRSRTPTWFQASRLRNRNRGRVHIFMREGVVDVPVLQLKDATQPRDGKRDWIQE